MASEDEGFKASLRVLRPGPFRRYMIGEGISMTGTWMQLMAQGWVMSTLTTSAFMLGVVNFAAGVPPMLLSMYGGSLADRFDKRRILQLAQVTQIAIALLMAALIASHQIALWHVMAFSVLLGVVTAFEMPAATALVPELVAPEQMSAAIMVDRALFHGTRLVGPAVAGWAVGAFGAASAYVANALTFVALMIAIATLPPRAVGTAEEEEARQGGIGDGLRFVLGERAILMNIATIAMSTLFAFPIMIVMMPIYATQTLHLDAAGMGMLASVSGVGSLAGVLGMLSVSRDKRLPVKVVAVLTVSGALFGLSLAGTLAQAAASMVALTVGLSSLIGLANVTIQERAPAAMRGRVSAIAGLAFMGLGPIAGLLTPGAADIFGMQPALAGCGALFFLGASTVLLIETRCREDALTSAPYGPSAIDGGLPVGGSSPSGSSSTEASAP